MSISSTTIDFALEYAAQGWRVLPVYGVTDGVCSCGRNLCDSVGKHPRINGWKEKATTDPNQIQSWWAQWPDANIGIATGEASNLFVVDVDGEEGEQSLQRWIREYNWQARHANGDHGYNDLGDKREQRVRLVSKVAAAYLEDYRLKHRSGTFAKYAVGHITRHLGGKMLVDISDTTVREYQLSRLKEKAAPKSVNEEVGFLLRLLGERGDAIRGKLRRDKALKLRTAHSVGKAFSADQKDHLLKAAVPASAKGAKAQKGTRSPNILPALVLAFNAGLRDAEIRNLTWAQIDFQKRLLTVGSSKTEAGEGRTIPLNGPLVSTLVEHSKWYTDRFGMVKPEWHVFPGRVGKPAEGQKRPLDPSKPISSLKTAWRNVRAKAGVSGRFHDTRHTLITELSESGAGDQTIMDIAGHVSRQMLARYSHIRMEAKRTALEAVGTKIPSPSETAVEASPSATGNVQ